MSVGMLFFFSHGWVLGVRWLGGPHELAGSTYYTSRLCICICTCSGSDLADSHPRSRRCGRCCTRKHGVALLLVG
jgi:hypothetical protein